MATDTIVLKMDAYHDMVAEIGVLKKQAEHDAATVRQLRDANKEYLANYQTLHDAIIRLQAELQEAKSQPRMFRTVKVPSWDAKPESTSR